MWYCFALTFLSVSKSNRAMLSGIVRAFTEAAPDTRLLRKDTADVRTGSKPGGKSLAHGPDFPDSAHCSALYACGPANDCMAGHYPGRCDHHSIRRFCMARPARQLIEILFLRRLDRILGD